MNIFKERMSPNWIMDIVFKTISGALLILAITGLIGVVYHMITNPSSVSNAQFGIFDYI